MNLKVNFKKLLPLAVSGCVLAGTLSGCSYQSPSKKGSAIIHLDPNEVTPTPQATVEESYDYAEPVGQYDNTYYDDQIRYQESYAPAPIQDNEDNYYMNEEQFFTELGEKTNARVYLYDVSSDFCKRVKSRHFEGSGELIDNVEEYLIDGRVVYRSGYESRKAYRNPSNGEVVTFDVRDNIPADVYNNWEYVGLRSGDVSLNTIVEGSNTTIFEDEDGVSIVSSVPVSRDEFFHFLEYEDEFVNMYFGYRPEDYESAVSYQDPDKDYAYEYATKLTKDGYVLSGVNKYVCNGELYFASGYDQGREYFTDGYFSNANQGYSR